MKEFLMNYGWQMLILIICLLASGFLSSSELAYTVVNKLRLKKESEEGNKSARLAVKIIGAGIAGIDCGVELQQS